MSLKPDKFHEIFRPPAFVGSYFISFEGIEGAGKSIQINTAKQYLESKGYRVLVLREPGGTQFGEILRKAILEQKDNLHPLAEAHLFASSRAQLLHEVTLKELNTPNTVIIYDRYIDSSIAYQGSARGLGIETILGIHENFPLCLMPHLTFYLRIDLKTSMERQEIRNDKKDYFESQPEEFYKKLIEGYEKAVKIFDNRIKVIDGSQSIEKVALAIQNRLEQLITS
jgi:dTMP kinase